MHESLAGLEKLMEAKGGLLEAPIPMEANGLLGGSLQQGFIVQRAWTVIGTSSISSVLVQVRSRLLDFVLSLQDKLGENVSEREIRQQAEKIDARSLFNNSIFGDNATIVVGEHNKQRITNTSIKNDLNALADELRKNGIAESDITALEGAIKADEGSKEVTEQTLGPSVKRWLSGMFTKALDLSGQVNIEIVANIAAAAIQKYYGW